MFVQTSREVSVVFSVICSTTMKLVPIIPADFLHGMCTQFFFYFCILSYKFDS